MALFQLRYMSWSCFFFFCGIGFKDNCRYVGEASSILRRPLPLLYLVRTLLHCQFFSISSSLFAGSVLFLLGRILNMIQFWKMWESGGSLTEQNHLNEHTKEKIIRTVNPRCGANVSKREAGTCGACQISDAKTFEWFLLCFIFVPNHVLVSNYPFQISKRVVFETQFAFGWIEVPQTCRSSLGLLFLKWSKSSPS